MSNKNSEVKCTININCRKIEISPIQVLTFRQRGVQVYVSGGRRRYGGVEGGALRKK